MSFKFYISIGIVFCFISTCVYAQEYFRKHSANSNHRELAIQAFQLAVTNGFSDPFLSNQEIQDRLEAGVYSEDYENIPGIIGSHFPDPWSQGPDFNFLGLYPVFKIPYGKLTTTSSGWYRGFMHGYDPVQGFLWPGAAESTIDWANSIYNSYTWDNAISLYNNGKWQKAYQCLGHVLHLLTDLSVPAHVLIVDHGGSLKSKNAGTFLNPDIGKLVVDEYERALNGGLELSQYPGIYFIPNLLADFRSALDSADIANIPVFSNWQIYLDSLAKYTYYHPLVSQYYLAPDSNGIFGHTIDTTGVIVDPNKYGITPPTDINGRWTQFEVYSTVEINLPVNPIIPKNDMKKMCKDLVPKAVEFGAGLIQQFLLQVVPVLVEIDNIPNTFLIKQNYPNPFNPITKIEFSLPYSDFVILKIYNSLGQEVETLISEKLNSGDYGLVWDSSGFASGVYYYKIQVNDYIQMKKMILLK
jgi:hypothetical protein